MKTILLGILLLGLALPSMKETGTLSGAVTYLDSNEPMNHADVGSEVYVISETELESTQFRNIGWAFDNFQWNKIEYSIALNKTIDPVEIQKSHDNFSEAARYTANYFTAFKKSPSVIKAKANGTGRYTLDLKPGRYHVFVVSACVKSDNVAEAKGNIDYKIVYVKPNSDTHLDLRFEKQEGLWIQLIKRRSPEGC
jgi:hypothetical protein